MMRTGGKSREIHIKKYNVFRGVDFSKDASMVDDEHSPDAINLISDVSGFPEKRLGWRCISSFEKRINGIYSFDEENKKCTIVHAGDKLYKFSEGNGAELIKESIADSKSRGKYFKGKLCILTGREYLVFDGEKCISARDGEEMYAPVTLISREAIKVSSLNPTDDVTFRAWNTNGVFENLDGTEANYGEIPESLEINLVSPRRENHFAMGRYGTFLFVLDSVIERGSRVVMRYIPTGEVLFDVCFDNGQAEQRYNSYTDPGVNDELLQEYIYSSSNTPIQVRIGNSEKNNCGYVVCQPRMENIIGYHYVEGMDVFSIEFSHTIAEYEERINKCTVMDVFENRIFFSGNPDYPNLDWYSGANDPLYVPDINCMEIGVDSCSVKGYLPTGSSQAILKGDGEDAAIYMRSREVDSKGKETFSVRQGVSGMGALGSDAICSFLDDPLYLTRNGVYAVALQDVSLERSLNVRSTMINKRLLKHESLSETLMCEWNGYMILCVDGVAYIADAAQKRYTGNKTGTFEYEWYYWTNIPARVLYEHKGELWFGTSDGKLCKFNTDLKNSDGEIKSEAYSDDGEAILAQWATNLSDDGDFMTEKTLVKTGSGVLIKAYNRSGVSVIVRTERDFGKEVIQGSVGMFNFENTEFSDLTLNSATYAMVPLNSQIKKYGAIQIICRNEKKNHAFGIGGIVRRYFKGKIKK